MEYQAAATAKAQETENRITKLEQEYGISPTDEQRANNKQEPGKPQPKITREEYEVIKSVFERLGCDSLISYSGFFGDIAINSFCNFFVYQVPALEAIFHVAETTTDIEVKRNLLHFTDELKTVNGTIYDIAENAPAFAEAEKLCDALDEARYIYMNK